MTIGVRSESHLPLLGVATDEDNVIDGDPGHEIRMTMTTTKMMMTMKTKTMTLFPDQGADRVQGN